MQTPQFQLLFLFLFLSSCSLITSSSPPFPLPPVLGDDGKELRLGKPYFPFSTIYPRRDGLCLVDNVLCPEDIIQCPTYYDVLGFLPVTFTSVNLTEDSVVRENTPYRIQFTIPGIFSCSPGKYWYAKNVGNPIMEFVAIGPDTVAVDFIIQKDSAGYKISYCFMLPIPPVPICYGIGFGQENGFNRLGFGEGIEPAQFYFSNNITSISTNPFDKIPMF